MSGHLLTQKLEDCIKGFRDGTLSEEALQDALATANRIVSKNQDILYLQAASTSLTSQVHGMSLMQDGQYADEIPDAADWPYQTVLQAIRDGWRVVQFPNLALLLDDEKTYGLGCEFILER